MKQRGSAPSVQPGISTSGAGRQTLIIACTDLPRRLEPLHITNWSAIA